MRPTLISAAIVVVALGSGCGSSGAGGDGAAGTRPGSADTAGLSATVTSVNDGDTVTVEVGGRRERVRMVGIDTPEVAGPYTEAECFGAEASARTKGLLRRGDDVRLVRDPTQPERDRFDRLLAYVHRPGDASSLNERLVTEGYAEVFRARPHFSEYARFTAAERAARDARRGMWGACPARR